MKHVPFAHLHVHSEYSLLDGACTIPDLLSRAIRLGFPAIALTDHGNLFAAISFYTEAMKQGIKPILGMEGYIAPGSRFEKTSQGLKEKSHHIVLLARNEEGYHNLMKLSSLAYLEGFYYKPRFDKELLKEYASGLIGLSGCLSGEVPHLLLSDRIEEAERAASVYAEIFGKENFYLELQDQGLPEQKKLNERLVHLSRNLEIPLVATNDLHYLERDHARVHEVLLCIQTGTTLDDPHRMKFDSDEFYLKSFDEMRKIFAHVPEAVENSFHIAERCNVELDLGKTHLPRFVAPEGKSLEIYLAELCDHGLKKKEGAVTPEASRRLSEELAVIAKTGFSGYFLVVWDFIRFAKESGIPVGPGRGSAAGSLVAYALDITDINPLQHGLIFERFLNAERVSMPDIDIDFCYERRDEVIEYVRKKYGRDNVAQIITFGTMMARAVVRDVGRVLGLTYPEVDRVAKLVPHELNMTLAQALKIEPRLKQLVEEDARVARLLEVARSLEGQVRHAATHAAGVVIADRPLAEYVPLYKEKDQITTQYAMKSLEKIGLLKMDFLGLKTLTVIEHTLKWLEKTRGAKLTVHDIPFTDPKTYAMLCSAETAGIFQLESSGMRDLLRKLRPQAFEDIVALLALYRPGPLGSGMVEDFIRRKHNPALIQYDHPALVPVLKETYGVILYQEQVMRIVSELAGFSLAKADSVRRAMGKKIPEVMEAEKKSFLEGCSRKDIGPRVAEKIWGLIEYFAGYGFNKSHSAAYAFISYQTAYLKANFPVEFMTALLTSEKDNTDKIVRYIDEAKRLGLQILPPSVNESASEFTALEGSIRFGLSAVKNVGLTAIESILSARRLGGRFESFYDFAVRVDLRTVNRKVIESLVKCGACDEFGLKRAQLVAMIDRALEMAGCVQRDRSSGQFSFLDAFESQAGFRKDIEEVPAIEEWPENQLLAYERSVLGFYITSHPLARYERVLKSFASVTTIELEELEDGKDVALGGVLSQVKEVVTRKGDRMAFLTLEDLQGVCEVVVFPDLYQRVRSILEKDNIVFIKGVANVREDVAKVVAQDLFPLDDVTKRLAKVVTIDLEEAGLEPEKMERLRRILLEHPGPLQVELSIHSESGKRVIIRSGQELHVAPSEELFSKVNALIGKSSCYVMG